MSSESKRPGPTPGLFWLGVTLVALATLLGWAAVGSQRGRALSAARPIGADSRRSARSYCTSTIQRTAVVGEPRTRLPPGLLSVSVTEWFTPVKEPPSLTGTVNVRVFSPAANVTVPEASS
jgi:hypothetical protein